MRNDEVLWLLRTVMEGRVCGKTSLGRPRKWMLSDEEGHENIKQRTNNRWEWAKYERACLRPDVKQNTQTRHLSLKRLDRSV